MTAVLGAANPGRFLVKIRHAEARHIPQKIPSETRADMAPTQPFVHRMLFNERNPINFSNIAGN